MNFLVLLVIIYTYCLLQKDFLFNGSTGIQLTPLVKATLGCVYTFARSLRRGVILLVPGMDQTILISSQEAKI